MKHLQHWMAARLNKALTPASVALESLSAFLVLGFFYYIYTLFQRFDWGQSFTKLMCFSAAVFTLTVLFKARKYEPGANGKLRKARLLVEITCYSLVLIWTISSFAPNYLTRLNEGPRVDIGYTTQNSAIVLFRENKNPYQSTTINVRKELKPKYRGFHYGPGMLIGYFYSAIKPNVGYKVTNLIFFLLTIGVLLLVLDKKELPLLERTANATFAVTLFLLPERLWYETFMQGANDIFPVLLILAGLLFIKHKQWMTAGIFLGFSFATKFSPAAFLLILFLRKDLKLNFLTGCAIGCLPLAAFFLWDFSAVMQNVFILRFTLGYDSTSLYAITPKELHYIFPLIQLSAVVYFLIHNFREKVDLEKTVFQTMIFLAIIEVTFKEIHANHLVWFYPFFALVAAQYRTHLFARPLAALRNPIVKT